MRKKINYLIIILIFIILFLFKDYLYSLFSYAFVKDNKQLINIEMEILKSENYNLKQEITNLEELYEIKVITKYDYLISKVSFRNIYTFYDSLIIQKGSDDNLKPGMAVITEKGLVGTIKEVNKNSSLVELITNPTNEISVIVHGSYGILSGFSKEKNLLIIKNMNNYDNIEIGDYVYTSGLGKLPQGIFIGKVEKIEYDNYQIEQKIYIKSNIDFNNINYLGIIKLDGEE